MKYRMYQKIENLMRTVDRCIFIVYRNIIIVDYSLVEN